jgi:isoprenylcysteine carboxyl methyltransferase (ICMT) family protein YpbQ
MQNLSSIVHGFVGLVCWIVFSQLYLSTTIIQKAFTITDMAVTNLFAFLRRSICFDWHRPHGLYWQKKLWVAPIQFSNFNIFLKWITHENFLISSCELVMCFTVCLRACEITMQFVPWYAIELNLMFTYYFQIGMFPRYYNFVLKIMYATLMTNRWEIKEKKTKEDLECQPMHCTFH